MRFWSVSTTIRNADRIRPFLKVLKTIEGEEWTAETQVKYQILLIKHKVYGFGNAQFHSSLSKKHEEWINSSNFSYEQALDIFYSKNYEDPPMRGRQSYNPLEKMGFTYIDKNRRIVITDFGNYFLEEDYDLGEIFFRSFIKWQYPSPDSNKYKGEEGYNIKPFIATLHLISKVNEKCKEKKIKEKGVSRLEFALFFVTLSNYKDIDKRANELIDFRMKYEAISDKEKQNIFVKDFFNNYFSNYESFYNANNYTDNIIRYFRLTRYIYIRGNGWYIDIEPRRKLEIKALLETDNASAKEFESANDYIQYLGDINKPVFPWEKQDLLKKVLEALNSEVYTKYLELKAMKISLPAIPEIDMNNNNIEYLKSKIKKLRDFRRKIIERETHYLSQSEKKIEQYIDNLLNIFKITKGRPVELERNISLGLNALNDAIDIKPNYPVGDDNEPTYTAPSNKPDIECFYESFYSICEVTLLTNRSQWYNEGQPVMRHIRDFENVFNDKETYCLFVAPKLHRDTINTFWISVKYEYEGKPQKIVPLSISQFIYLLEIQKQLKVKGIFLTHLKIKDLYDSIVKETQNLNNSDEWIAKIPELIENWKKSLVA